MEVREDDEEFENQVDIMFRELKAKADRVAERELRAYEKDEDMTSEVVRRAAERYRARQQAQK